MKKLLISASIFLNVAFFIIACTKKDMQVPVASNHAATTNVYENPAADYSDHFHGLTLGQVTQMLGNYESHQSAVINATMGITDARSCWFSLNALKNFIGHLEVEVQKNSAIGADGLGVRFYYGAHSNPATLAGIPANYAGLHNLVMIPTYKDVTGINADFDPYRIDQQTGIPLPLNFLNRVQNTTRTFSTNGATSDSSSYEIFSMDHGSLYPPDETALPGN